MQRPGHIAVLVLLLGLAIAPGRVIAQDSRVVDRRMAFAEKGGDLVMTTSFRELLDGRLSNVQSGLPTSLVVRIYVYERGKTLPISLQLVSIRLVYDLWDEVYLVRTEGPLGQRTQKFDKQEDAVTAATMLDKLPIAPLERVGIGPRYFVALIAELNPLSPELLAEVRGWLSKPTSERDLGMSSAFFGSFVSIFSNLKLPPADAVLRLRSQLFYRVPR